MKKILFAAVAAMAITGCSQNEEIEKAAQAGDPKAMKEYEKILENRKKATASTQKWRNKQKKKALEPTYQIEPEPTELEPEQELPVTASA